MALFTLLLPGAAWAQAPMCPAHLVTVEPDGSVGHGSLEALRGAYRAGLPLRIGWELDWSGDDVADVTHWADAAFLSEFEGQFFAQVVEIHRQVPRPGQADISLGSEYQRWTGLLGTDGVLKGRFSTDPTVDRFAVRSHWCVDPRVPRDLWKP